MKIQHLQIQTSRFRQQLEFYKNVLELPISKENNDEFTVKIGYSLLEFFRTEKSTPYHIAFHIGANQENEALLWLKKQVPILKNEGKEIVDFPNWNAKSIYFYDADKNIIEVISRKHLFKQNRSFSEENLMGIAEIGLATTHVHKIYDFLNRNFSLDKFTGNFEEFCAVGDEKGLFIVVDKNKKDWFPSKDKAFSSDFQIEFIVNSQKINLSYKREILTIL